MSNNYFVIPQCNNHTVYHKGIHSMGFSAKFLLVLDQLLRMDSLSENNKIEYIPYIDWETRYSSLHDYSNEEIKNEWEYCFENFERREIVFSSNHILSDGEFRGIHVAEGQIPPKVWIKPQDKIFLNKELVTGVNDIIKKYIKVKKNILDELLIVNPSEKILAVHCRRSEMHLGHSNIALNYENEIYFNKVMKIYNEGGFDKIYLATEEIDIINYFKEKIEDILIFQECYRIQRTGSPFEASWLGDPRHNHFTLHTQEVLKDILNMSNCDSLICGISGVSNNSIYFNGLNYNNVYYFDEINI
jgi:hypothetical protein